MLRFRLIRLASAATLLVTSAAAFSIAHHADHGRTSVRPRFATTNQDFEYQEMRAIIDSMDRENVPSRYMNPEKRQELEGYVRSVISSRSTGTCLPTTKEDLVGTTWRLAFSTEAAALGELPKDATVRIEFLNAERLSYSLDFSEQTMGLNRLQAESTWELDGTTGSVTYVYDKISTDAFGFRNVGIGLFGLLKGRPNYVFTAYFDGAFWIEGAVDEDGSEYINVYVRQGDGWN